MKKISLILLSVATLLAMTACGGRNSKNSNAKFGDQSEQATEVTTKAQEPEDKSLEGTKRKPVRAITSGPILLTAVSVTLI